MKKLLKFLGYKIYTLGEEYKRSAKADDLCSFIWEFQQYLREQVRYAETPDDIDTIYARWFEELNDHNIDLEDIYS